MAQITILKLKSVEGKNQLRAFVDVSINSEITINGIRLMKDPKDFWIWLPQTSYQSNGQTKYAPIITVSDELKKKIRDIILAAFFKESQH